MARIRSIKPEYWKSESIAALSMQTRLTFIALWSYVDDNGVGRDVEKLIAAELYPLEDDPRATLAHVVASLDELADKSRIVRYTVHGKPWLYVTNWSEHQKIDRPNKARYPLPAEADEPLTCGNIDPRDSIAQPSRNPRASPSPGAVDQGSSGSGNRGTGEALSATLAKDDPTSSLLIEHANAYTKPLPPTALSQVRTAIMRQVADGTPADQIRAGLARMREKSLSAGLLPQLIAETIPTTDRRPGKPSTTDQRVGEALALADKFASKDRQEITG